MKVTSSQVLGIRSWISLGGHYHAYLGFPGGGMVKNLPKNAGDTGAVGSVLGLGRSPGEGNGIAPPYSCLENPMDREALQAIVHGVTKKSDTNEHAHMHAILHTTNSLLLSSLWRRTTPETLGSPACGGELLLRLFVTHSSLTVDQESFRPPWS